MLLYAPQPVWRYLILALLLCVLWRGASAEMLIQPLIQPDTPARSFVIDYLRSAPATVDAGHASFAVAGEYMSYAEALTGLAQLRRRAPEIRVAVYPPYGQWRGWAVMAAAYATPKDAHFAVDMLLDRRVSSGPYVRSVADMAGKAIAWVPEAESRRDKIISCLGRGVSTIGAMHACAGAIVTPASLTRCLVGGLCSLELDPIDAPNYLAAQGLSQESPLLATAGGALSPLIIASCVKHNKDAAAATACLATASSTGATAACLEHAGEAAATCLFESKIDPHAKALYDCMQKSSTLDQVAACAGKPVPPELVKTQQCIARNPGVQNAMAQCLPSVATSAEKEFIGCVAQLRSGKSQAQDCMQLHPEWRQPMALGQCLQTAKAAMPAILDCARRGGMDVPVGVSACAAAIEEGQPALCAVAASDNPVIRCVTAHRGNPDDLWLCMAAPDPQAKAAVDAYRCLSSGAKTAALLASCSVTFLQPATRQVATCLADAAGKAAASTVCVVSQSMGTEEARLLNCAANATNYVGFGICAVAPQMNQEWRITAECVAAGGEPIVVAGCVAGRLTAAELQKCFTQGIGKDGCFGENNTIVVGLRNAVSDITRGPGPNNDVVKAINKVGEVLGGISL